MDQTDWKEETHADDNHSNLWRQYQSVGDKSARTELIKLYLPFARKVAARLYSMRTTEVLEFDDYFQYATVGLLEAIENYAPGSKAKFETYATYRVRGAILNGLEQGSEKLAQGAYRKRFLADRLESIDEGFRKDEDSGLFKEMVDAAIGMALGYLLEDSGVAADAQQDNPYKQLEVQRLKSRLNAIVSKLSEKEKLIIQYHYFEHINFNEIALLMQLTKGRVSQLHCRALMLILESYNAMEEFSVTY